MKTDRTDKLIQLAWIEGWLNTHGAYEKAVAKREVRTSVSPAARATLIARLETALAETRAELPLTVGV